MGRRRSIHPVRSLLEDGFCELVAEVILQFAIVYIHIHDMDDWRVHYLLYFLHEGGLSHPSGWDKYYIETILKVHFQTSRFLDSVRKVVSWHWYTIDKWAVNSLYHTWLLLVHILVVHKVVYRRKWFKGTIKKRNRQVYEQIVFYYAPSQSFCLTISHRSKKDNTDLVQQDII